MLEYMKGGQMVTHPCAPFPRIEFRHLQVVSMCNCSAWCMIARRISKLNICRLRILHCLCQHGCEPEIFMFPRLSCVCMHLEMWAEVKVHSYHAHAHVCASSCMCCAQATPLQATVGVGTVIIPYIGVAYTRGGSGTSIRTNRRGDQCPYVAKIPTFPSVSGVS